MQPSTRDRILLTAGGLLAAASTLRVLGAGITIASAALLAAGSLCALIPVTRMLSGGETSRRTRKTVLGVVFGAHLVATLFFFPPEDAANDRPVLTLDHSLHYYQVHRARTVFTDSRRCFSYDPYFMAGYPGGTVFDVDSKGVELWCSLMRPLDTARAYKLFILLGYLLFPLTVYAGSRRMGFSFEESLLGVLVLLAWWHWGRPYASDFRFAGMFSYLIVMHLSFYITGLFRSLLRGERAAPFFIAGPLAFLVHPTASVMLPVPFVALFLAERRRIPPGALHRRWELRLLGLMLIWCLLVLAVNAVWLIQLWRYLDIKIGSESFFQVAGPAGMARLLLKWSNLPAIGIMGLAVAGSVVLARARRTGEAAAPVAGAAFLLLIATFGIYIPLIDQMEPGRFIVPAFVFMAPLAGTGCIASAGWAARVMRIPAGTEALRKIAEIILVLCIPVFGMLSARAFYRHTVGTTFTPEVKEMLYALEKYTDTSGRLMIEDGPAWNYGDNFLVSIIPMRTGVEQIGGPYPFAFIRHNFSNFSYCRAFDKAIGGLQPGILRRYIDMYNIHWVLTASDGCREALGESGVAEAVWSSRHFTLWEVPDPSVFTDTPGVSVDATYGSLRVLIGENAGVRPGGWILLKYHWDRGMTVTPPARIAPRQVFDDPVPFVQLLPNGAHEVQIIVK